VTGYLGFKSRHILRSAVLTGAVSLALTGCVAASESVPSDEVTASTSESSTQRPGAGTRSLPDSVPLVANAELAEQAKTFSDGAARGWSAVALTPPGTNATTVAGEVNAAIKQAGWVTAVTGSASEGLVISATRVVGAKREWLNINVTTDLPASGPAVTYRYGTMTQTASPKPTVTTRSTPSAAVQR
jgi:hypothetical protein